MDPNAALALLRERMRYIREMCDREDAGDESDTLARHASDAVDAFESLDAWLMRGGFLPAAWSRDHLPGVELAPEDFDR